MTESFYLTSYTVTAGDDGFVGVILVTSGDLSMATVVTATTVNPSATGIYTHKAAYLDNSALTFNLFFQTPSITYPNYTNDPSFSLKFNENTTKTKTL